MDKLEFWTICSANGIVLDKEQVDIFERFHNDLLYWNEKVNLISRKDEANVWERHILHSLAILTQVTFGEKSLVMDVGTGGGFPGIPLKIAMQGLRMNLVDSIAKKVKLTQMFAEHTGLRGIQTFNKRVEELAKEKEFAGLVDVVVARGVAQLDEIVWWTKTLLKPKGRLVLLKGGDLTEEVRVAKEKFPRLHVEVHPLQMRGVPWFEEQKRK